MKRGSGHIATLFGKYEAKKFASSESPSAVIDLQAEGTPGSRNLLQFLDSPHPVDTNIETETDAQATTTPSPNLPSGESADTYLPFEWDPAKRIPISSYDANDQDDVREAKQKMDAAGTSKRGRRPSKPQKLRFKPKVPSQKKKKSTAQKPQLEETKPVDEELLKTLRTCRGDAKTLRVIKDEQSAQNSGSMVSSATGVSLPPRQPGGQKIPQPKKALRIPRTFPVAANPERFYGYEDDDEEEEDDNNVDLQESLPSSIECESSIHPAKELNLLLPKSLPLLRRSSTVVQRNGKAIVKEVKKGYNLNDLPGGYMGKMLVYKSGKVKMKLGDAMFDVNPGTECGMTQHAVAVNTKEKHCCQLGEIENRHVIVTPDVNSLLNDKRG